MSVGITAKYFAKLMASIKKKCFINKFCKVLIVARGVARWYTVLTVARGVARWYTVLTITRGEDRLDRWYTVLKVARGVVRW